MQRTIQLDINSDFFDKVMLVIRDLVENFLPKNKFQLKEITNVTNRLDDEYFYSQTDKYIFVLTELDGKNRRKILGISFLHYKDKDIAKKWRKEILKKIHPDICNHPKAKEACEKMDQIYNEMIM